MCAVIVTPGASHSGWPGGSGSVSKTSSVAAPISPVRNAASKAVSSTKGPRATFTRCASGFIADSTCSSTSPLVASVNGAARIR
jgi:hypothetical protein